MSANKKKRIKGTLNNNKSLRHQRSSLQVNLSCTMINDKLLDTEEGIYFKNINNLSLESNIIENSIIEHSSLQKISKSNHKSDYLIQILQGESVNSACQFSCDNPKIIENDKDINLSESGDTLQTSLNVNTSTDQINNSNKHKNKHEWKNSKMEKMEQKDVHSVGLNVTQESTSTICTSLQMNTSLDISNRLQKDSNVIKTFSTKSINLIEKQKNSCNSYNAKNNNFDGRKINSYEMQHQDETVLEELYNDVHSGIASNVVSLHDSSCKMLHIDLQTPELIKGSAVRSETKKYQNVKYSVATQDRRKCKRKLLPLCECSQLLSISPVEQGRCTSPQCLTFRKKCKRRKNRRNKVVNTSNTECIKRNNTQDYNKKKQKKQKKVISKKIVVKETVNENILRRLKKNKENYSKLEMTNIYTPERNSSDDFQPLKKTSVIQFTKKKQTQRLNIVTTGLSNEDKDIVKSVVRALGFAKIESHVTKHTTHLITTGVRTINLLHGIIRGCWLVSLEWVLKSLESNMWLNPEKYEMVHFSKAVMENRKDRQLFGKSYIPELFAACGYIYVEKNTTPPYNILKDLVKAGGGCITENSEIAKILIGTGGLKETWILDCITSGELQPYNQYQYQHR